MALARIENGDFEPLEEAWHQQNLMDVFNGAIDSMGYSDRGKNREVVDLLNVFTTLNWHQRFLRFAGVPSGRYILGPLKTQDGESGVVLSDEELNFIGEQLGVISNKTFSELAKEPELEGGDAEELVGGLCKKFINEDLEQEEFVSALRVVVLKNAELNHLVQTGRLE